MAYSRGRRTTRRSTGRSRSRSYGAPRRRRTTSRARSRVSGGSRTIRIVVQTVPGAGATQSGQAAVLPQRAMF